MAMHDVEKTSVRSGYQNAKRMRRRKRLMPIYAFTVLLLTACVGIALSMTVFFNVASIGVSGNAPQYSPVEIVRAGGAEKGDNLLRLDAAQIEENIETELIYVEEAEVSKEYPDAVSIEVRACRESYNVMFDNGILLTSESGKIIANSAEVYENLPEIYGFNPTILTPGKHISSSDEIKDEIFAAFADIMNKELSVPITSIDMSDKYNIIVMFDDRIKFSMGNWNEISYKVTLAEAVINRLGKDKEGYLTMIGNNQCSFRDKASVELANQIAAAGTTTVSSGAEGAVSETTTTITVAEAGNAG
ncbi:MAG: FtsQ-type POTRA domain-containing protein [Oscillospiraceae bacterium]|nr:FtsQ-type POTRA domain-containing protein [Oscillospiraceae bacterium]